MSVSTFLNDRVTLHGGDCLAVLATLPEASVDSVVTDPPYHLTSIVKRYGGEKSAPTVAGVYGRSTSGFMGKQWDGGDIAFRVELWSQVLRVLKPGGHLVAFSGTRTYHRMVCAIEDAGFEIRDQIGWAYGSGFPKSHDVSKGIDKAAGAEREVVGRRTDGRYAYEFNGTANRPTGAPAGSEDAERIGGFVTDKAAITAPSTESAKQWQGWGTALKPAWEPICLARKPLIGTVAENVLKFGTGAINVDGCRVEAEASLAKNWDRTQSAKNASGTIARQGGGLGAIDLRDYAPVGRWPANLILDSSEEVLKAFPETQSGGAPTAGDRSDLVYSDFAHRSLTNHGANEGSAARFFYTAKADAEDRLGSKHPTVKPLDLMQWLVRLVTPKGGTCLDMFAGTGTTGEAAWREGMNAILIEREPEYQADIARRMDLAAKPTKRAAVAKTKNKLDKPEDLPLFARDAAE